MYRYLHGVVQVQLNAQVGSNLRRTEDGVVSLPKPELGGRKMSEPEQA